jgi:hypothetical protein
MFPVVLKGIETANVKIHISKQNIYIIIIMTLRLVNTSFLQCHQTTFDVFGSFVPSSKFASLERLEFNEILLVLHVL